MEVMKNRCELGCLFNPAKPIVVVADELTGTDG